MTANVAFVDGDRLRSSMDNLRRLAAQASALDAAWPAHLKWILRRLGINLSGASRALLGLSNKLGALEEAWSYRRDACSALRLPAHFAALKGEREDRIAVKQRERA